MAIPIHRHGDSRICGATTIASNFGVYANSRLVAVDGDPNTHGGGNLIAANNNVYVGSKLVVNDSPEGAVADALCIPIGPPHCAPVTAGGSPNVNVGD